MKNKKLSIVFLAVVCAICSCNGGKSASQAEPLSTDNVSSVRKSGNLECKITVDYPNGEDSLSHSVAAYINGELGRQYLPVINSEDGVGQYPLYNGIQTSGKAVAEYYANGTIEYIKRQAKELKEAGMTDIPALTYELSVRKIADNDRYVSYETASYAFLGGAHGSSVDYAVNIAKQSGKVLTQAVDTLQAKAMQPVLRKGVLNYLHEQGDTAVTEKTLGEYLFVENGTIPLPVHTPYLAEDGVHFVYQQYEIGPYAMGMIAFTVPYDEIKPFLTKDALGLMKKE